MTKPTRILVVAAVSWAIVSIATSSHLCAQSVCLPSPRLLTTMPMGGQVGTDFDVTITGETIEGAAELVFSNPAITAKQKLDDTGKPLANQYTVSIKSDCPTGVHEARVMTRLGLSSSRIFTVSDQKELSHNDPAATLQDAVALPVNCICNAVMPVRAVNHYSFDATIDQRIVIDCAARGIDSELNPVLILADGEGRDLRVQRRGGLIDFAIPADGKYMVKVHDLTFNGGSQYFYRLSLRELPADAAVSRLPSTQIVGAHSWPPAGLAQKAPANEAEPNNDQTAAQKITLPCDIAGSFYPAADVDRFEFNAKKGETWWIEVASERLGRPTDPAVVVQQIETETNGGEKRTDVAQFADIASPVKVSSYGYSYDGPPYNAGSADILGKLEIKTDGFYRLQLIDLLGSTRNEPSNHYRLIIRKATPDFAVVMWPLHMQLRNGDRNALSKPIALRGGATLAYEAVAIRRDGFDGDIDLSLKGLPDGVTATGLKIAAGESRGTVLVTADEGAPRGFKSAEFHAHATIDGKRVSHVGHMASMANPVRNTRDQVTSPRLLLDIPVSVGGDEVAPLTIAPKEKKVFQAKADEKLTIPLIHMKRGEFSGKNLNAKTFGAGFEKNATFDIPLGADSSEAVLDLAKLKVEPGDYTIAFYGGAVAKYSHNPGAVPLARADQKIAKEEAAKADAEVERLTAEVKTASAEAKIALEKQLSDATTAKKTADAAVAQTKKAVANATKLAKKKDIADIIVSEPISIRVLPAEKK